MYPSFIVEYGVSPHHLSSKVFLGIVEWLRTTRLDAKHNGRKLEADALKIVINRIYGALMMLWIIFMILSVLIP